MATPTTNSGMSLPELVAGGKRAFSSHPQVSHYFPSVSMEDARRRIMRAIDRGDGPALVIGAAGTGKSLLLQALAAQYHHRFDIVLLACARLCTRRALLQTILFELGLSYHHRDEGQLRLSLLDHLLSEKQCPAGLLLLVDEAQALSIALLDELRVMTNLMRGGLPRVRLVLAGSAALEESFSHPDLESFSQRLSARCYLAPMSREETAQFVRSQLAAAGAAPDRVFAADAYESVFDATDGVPRLINQVCDRALVLAADENLAIVSRETIQAAWSDLQQLPTAWRSPPTSAAPAQTTQVIEFGSLSDAAIGDPEAPMIEPTELDLDEDEEIDLEPIVDLNPPQHAEPQNEQPSKPPRRTPHDPANPFTEEFDEEEVVLDTFASWDDLFHAGTPRVENCRDLRIANMIDAALEEPVPREPHPHQAEFQDVDSRADDDRASESDFGGDELAQSQAQTPKWPHLRLAIVPEPTGSELHPDDDAELTTIGPTGRTWRDHSMRNETPILIVEDEAGTPKNEGPPVRRLAYQHLFSRLRSG